MRYTLEEYSNISFQNDNYKLPENILNKIQNLFKELNILTQTQEDTDNKYIKSKYVSKQSRYTESIEGRINNKLDNSWKTNIQFKATKIEKKEGIEKMINDIRISLNKISIKNYNQQKEIIFSLIKELINEEIQEIQEIQENQKIQKNKEKTNNNKNEENIENKTNPNAFGILSEEDEEEDDDDEQILFKENIKIKQIAQCIFDIASSNKFYSELYAKLYKELLQESTIFYNFVVNLIEEYKKDIHNIKYVDSNKEYENFCENNKLNDKRKALTTFIANLMKEEILPKKDVFQLIIDLQESIILQIDIEDKSYQIDEITENIFILITLVANEFENLKNIEELKKNKKYKQDIEKLIKIKENIINCANYKSKQHKSISSRAIFKYMDMKEIILKKE